MSDKILSRREVLTLGKNAIIVSAVFTGISPFLLPEDAYAFEWRSLFQRKHQGGKAKVLKQKGKNFVDGKLLKLNDWVSNGKTVQVSSNSELLLSFPDDSVVKIKGSAKFTLELDQTSGGLINLALGALVGVISPLRKRRYLVKSPTAALGIKGTVFFHNVFDATKTDSRIPNQATDYVCICNGSLDYLHHHTAEVFKQDHSEHHSAYFLTPQSQKIQLQKAPMLEHTDLGINDVIESMRGKKHDQSWLQL